METKKYTEGQLNIAIYRMLIKNVSGLHYRNDCTLLEYSYLQMLVVNYSQQATNKEYS